MFDHTNFAEFDAAATIDSDLISPMCVGGLLAGTMVDTEFGWRRVESLVPGDRVQTFDGGLRPLTAVQHSEIDQPLGMGVNLVNVPAGVLDNCSDINLLAEQRVLLDLAEAEDRFGTPLVLVPAAALEGWNGVTCRESMAFTTAVSLVFADEEVLFANTGVLLHCPTPDIAEGPEVSGFFTALNFNQSRFLLGLDNGPGQSNVVPLHAHGSRVA